MFYLKEDILLGSSNAVSKEGTEPVTAGRELRALPPPASLVHARGTRHPSARPRRSFWCKPTCTSKYFWPSVRHRQRFPIPPISLTLIYFKISHRNIPPPPPATTFFTGHHLKPTKAKRGSCWTLLASDQALLPHGANLFIRRRHSYQCSTRCREDRTRDTTWSLRTPRSPPRLRGGVCTGCATPAEHSYHWHPVRWGKSDMPETKAFLLFFCPFSPSLHQRSKWRAPCSVTEGSKIAVIWMQPKRHSAIQLNQYKLTSQPWRSCSSPMEEKIILEPCLLCKGEKAWESPHCLSILLKSLQLKI